MDLGFNTGITWITKPAVTGVQWTQVSAMPAAVKTGIYNTKIPNTNVTIGRVSSINSKEPVMKQALVNLVMKNESWPTLTNKFPELSVSDWKPLMDFAIDSKYNDNLTKISRLYPELSDDFKQRAFDSIKEEQAKWAAKPTAGHNILGWILDSLSAPMQIMEKWANKLFWENDTTMQYKPQAISWGNPNTVGWNAAKTATDVIQMFTPTEVWVVEWLTKIPMIDKLVEEGSTVAKVSKRLSNNEEARPIIQKVTQAVTKAIAQWTLDASKYDAIAEHKLTTPEEALTFGIFNLALWQALPLVTKLWWKIVKWVVGKLTGTSWKTIETAIENAGNKEFTKALRGWTPIESTLENAQNMVENMKSQKNLIYGKWAKKLEQSTAQIDLPAAWQEILSNLENKWIKIMTDANENYILNWKSLDFSKSTISQKTHQDQIRNLVDEIRKRNDTSAIWADTLKQRVSNLYKWWTENTLSDTIILDASNKIGNKIKKNVPEYADMMTQYSKFKDTEQSIKQALSIDWNVSKTNKQTAITKIMNLLNDNKEYSQSVADELQKYWTKNFKWQIAGQALNPLLPKWFMGRIEAGWLAILGLLHPTMRLWLIASSPRLIWELSNIIWISSKVIEKAIKYLPKNAINRWTSLAATKFLTSNQ